MGERVGQISKVPEIKQSNSNSRVRKTERLQSMDTRVDRILFLQRTVGNQAVQRLLRSGALQAKLSIGQPVDVYEQEADRVVDAVMRMPEPGVPNALRNHNSLWICLRRSHSDQHQSLPQRTLYSASLMEGVASIMPQPHRF